MSGPPRDRPVRPRTKAESLVVVFTGDGKGKTSAAMGTVMRAIAAGWRVRVVQFVKSGRWRPGEREIAERLGVAWSAIGDGFTWDAGPDAGEATAREAWRVARAAIAAGEHRLVVLDEITYPAVWGWIDGNEVAAAIRNRPSGVSVVVTGRDAPTELVAVADTVTEMVPVRHAFERGIAAMRGIDL